LERLTASKMDLRIFHFLLDLMHIVWYTVRRVELCSTLVLVQVFLLSGDGKEDLCSFLIPSRQMPDHLPSKRTGLASRDRLYAPTAATSSDFRYCYRERYRPGQKNLTDRQSCTRQEFKRQCTTLSMPAALGTWASLPATAWQESLTRSCVGILYRSLSRDSPRTRPISISAATYPISPMN
jgi:hypothetical protein